MIPSPVCFQWLATGPQSMLPMSSDRETLTTDHFITFLDAKSKFLKLHGLGNDPTTEVRDVNTPVGLRNLGATCYVSSHG